MMTRVTASTLLCCILLVVGADAFVIPAASTTTTTTRIPASVLYMNKKKSKKKSSSSSSSSSSSGGGGFGGFATATVDPFAKFPFAGEIRPGKQLPQRVVVDESIIKPDYADDGEPKRGKHAPLLPWVIEVKTADEIEKMKAAGKLARDILDLAGRAVKVGITTEEIDTIVHEAVIAVRICII